MKAAVLYNKNDIRYEEVEEPHIINGNDVKVKVKACGICRSDVPRVLDGTAHFFPLILGHEFSGIVVEVGRNVKAINVGDHVAGVPLMPCFECEDCRNGNYSLCKNYSFIGSRCSGAYAEYIVLPEKNVMRINKNVSFEQGALIETATVALHAFYVANYDKEKAKNVAVLGFGTVGAFAVQWAKILDAENIVVFGRNSERLEFAKELGATHVINTRDENYMEQALKITENRGFNYIFETAGSAETIRLSFGLAANKSDVCLVGTPTGKLEFDWREWEMINRKEFRLTGSWMSYSIPFPGKEWSKTIECMNNGSLKYDERFLHYKMDLSNIKKAFNYFKAEKIRGRIMLLIND